MEYFLAKSIDNISDLCEQMWINVKILLLQSLYVTKYWLYVHNFTTSLYLYFFCEELSKFNALVQRRIKIQFNDNEGGKYSISIDGNTSKDKILKIINLLDITEEDKAKNETTLTTYSKETSIGKIYSLIENKFSLGYFTSNNLLEAYEDEFNIPIKLSTISTYLSRLEQKQLLSRQRTSSGWTYQKSKLIQLTFRN